MLDSLRHWLEINSVLVWFVYGLVFFVLGLGITLRWRAHSHLELAGHLSWLAAFGFLHGLHEWGDLFIPIQATYLPARTITFLYNLHAILLALSFTVLFQFGAELLRKRWPALRGLPLFLFAFWIIWFLLPGVGIQGSQVDRHLVAGIWARYAIGFPGALVSAVALRYQSKRQIGPLHLKNIERYFLIASLALAAYSVTGGLIVPAANFFPANWLNNDTVTAVFINPPVIRSIIGLTLAVSVIRALEVFQIEIDRMIEQMHVERELISERDRIGRDLHDGAIQTIYTAGLLVESATRKLGPDNDLTKPLNRAGKAINEAISDLRSFIGGLRPPETVQSLRQALEERAADSQLASLVKIDWDLDLPRTDQNFQLARVPHVMGILNEALSNAIRHADARKVNIKAGHTDNRLMLTIQDDGRGFDPAKANGGFGLRNMRDRARLLDGKLQVQSRPGQGTKIVLTAPWETSA